MSSVSSPSNFPGLSALRRAVYRLELFFVEGAFRKHFGEGEDYLIFRLVVTASEDGGLRYDFAEFWNAGLQAAPLRTVVAKNQAGSLSPAVTCEQCQSNEGVLPLSRIC